MKSPRADRSVGSVTLAAVEDVLRFFPPEGLAARLGQSMSPDFWRRLCPRLTVSSEPFASAPPPSVVSTEEAFRFRDQMVEEGYFQSDPLLPPERVQACRSAVLAVVAAGFHPLFATVYDELWQLLPVLSRVLTPILGEGFRLVPNHWLWKVDSDARSGWPPHRDAPTVNTLRPDGRPTLITVWIPFTDATPLNSCIYLLPMSRDPSYPDNLREESVAHLQDIRALPVEAGCILSWNQYVLHWGSRSSPRAVEPRISWGVYFQSADASALPGALELSAPLTFEQRLSFIGAAMAPYDRLSPLPMPLRSFVAWTTGLTRPNR